MSGATQLDQMNPIRVMVVEDEPVLAALFGELLESMGYDVCAIEATESSAVAAARRCKPDLILIDVQLGLGSGISAIVAILSDGFVPHVFCGGDISCVRAMRPSAIAIQKPFRVSDLAWAINRALGRAIQSS